MNPPHTLLAIEVRPRIADANGQSIKSARILLRVSASGVSVADLYHSQLLLTGIMRDLGASLRQAGPIPMVTQLGYAAGMLLFVSLGDTLECCRVIV